MLTELPRLLPAGYHKRLGNRGLDVEWQVAMRPGQRRSWSLRVLRRCRIGSAVLGGCMTKQSLDTNNALVQAGYDTS